MTTQSLGYLNLLAVVGITKHLGGFKATDELLALYQIINIRDLPNTVCGICISPA